jgi:hypothetical protein
LLTLCAVQLYLPPDVCINKDFLRDVLAGRKALMKMEEVKFCNVPLYDELSLKSIAPQMNEDPLFVSFFPSNLPKGRAHDRSYFWNVLNTLHPEYVSAIVKFAEEPRHSAKAEKQAE